MPLSSANSLNSNAPFRAERTIRSLASIGFLQSDFETVIFPDGTSIQRERQTKAQAKIQALKIKHRNENLRRTLMLLSNAQDSTKKKIATGLIKNTESELNKPLNENTTTSTTIKKSSQENQSNTLFATTENLNIETTLNEISAIQKQIIAKSEITSVSDAPYSSEKEGHSKLSESKLSNLKKRIFG